MHTIHADLVFRRTPQRELRLDVRVPKNGARPGVAPPLVVYIPVGGFRKCVRAWTPWRLVDAGFAMASVECRVSSEAIAPAAALDAKAAIRWLRAHADRFGYRADAIGVWGISAGGLLASLLATSGDHQALAPDADDPHAGVSAAVQAACDQCGAPHDLLYFARLEIKARFAPVAENLRLYLGGPVEERTELARRVSPATYVSADCPPILLIHGDADTVVPVEDTIAFHEALTAVSVDSTLQVLPGAGHSWDAELTRDAIEAFFRRTLMK